MFRCPGQRNVPLLTARLNLSRVLGYKHWVPTGRIEVRLVSVAPLIGCQQMSTHEKALSAVVHTQLLQ
jgi:hypothetical protein